jgi:hypothetical protein
MTRQVRRRMERQKPAAVPTAAAAPQREQTEADVVASLLVQQRNRADERASNMEIEVHMLRRQLAEREKRIVELEKPAADAA